MSLAQIFEILKARWLTALGVLFFVVGAAAVVTEVLPKKYTATASVLLDVKSTDPILGAGIQALAINAYMATQADVISSERVISGALRKLGKDKELATLAKWKDETHGLGDLQAWLVEGVLKHFEVLPSRESNVITVSYSSSSPDDAATTANAIVNSYIDTTIELRTEPAKLYNKFFDARAKELRVALEKAQASLSAYQRKIGVIATDEKLDVENNRLADLSSQLVSAQNAAADSNSRKALSIDNAGSMPDVQASPLITRLNADLAEKQLELKKLSAKYAGHHPEIAPLRMDINEVQSQIDAETRKVLRGIALNDDAIQSKVAHLSIALEAQRSKLLRLKSQRDLAAVLQRDVANAEEAYSAAFARTTQSNLESQATQTNVSILKAASAPAKPSSPNRLKNLIVALVLGSLLGIASAIVGEIRDRRLRLDDDVSLLLRQPLFGVLPRSTIRRKSPRARMRPTKVRAIRNGKVLSET